MNVLVVTHNYAPDRAPRAFRWTAIAEHWAARGAHVDIVTTGRGGGPDLELRNGVYVHRVGERMFGRLRGLAGSASPPSGPPAKQPTEGAAPRPGIAKRLYDATWKKLYWPDHAALWYTAAARRARSLCRSRRYDAVITVSHPFTGHLVGLALARAVPAARWIVDVGDPFSLDDTEPFNNPYLYRRLNRRAERRVYRRCNAISVTVEGCRAAVRNVCPEAASKIVVIPPLLSLPVVEKGNPPRPRQHDIIDIAYLGVLYAAIRRPDTLLELFVRMYQQRPSLRLHFYGDIQDCTPAFDRVRPLVGKAIVLHGPVPRKDVHAAMAAADILVNIGNDTSFQLPSKLVEYASAGRPILNVVRKPNDTSVGFLHPCPAAMSLTCPEGVVDETHVKQALAFVTNPPPIRASDLERFLAPFHIGPVAEAYEALLQST